MLKVLPVKNYTSCGYPTLSEVKEKPDILKNVPNRWNGKPVVLGVLAAAASLTLAGCRIEQGIETAGEITQTYYTEETAFEAVREIAKEYGVSFEKEALAYADMPEKTRYLFQLQLRTIPEVLSSDKWLDGCDEEKRIGFEYSSYEEKDIYHLNINLDSMKDENKAIVDKEQNIVDADTIYDDEGKLKIAESNPELAIGVFYNSDEESFKTQVTDFFEYLRANGIIE